MLKIKLTTENSEKARQAWNEYGAGRTYMAPFFGAQGDRVLVELAPFSSRLYISGIFVNPDAREQGLGTGALKEILAIADKHGVECLLSPTPFGDKTTHKGLNKTQLKAWYKRHGFVKAENGDNMVRLPIAPVVELEAQETKRSPKP